jgi:TPP-dependent indolepyruvate ferredoxin oxidoreductase alpha subunit
MFDTEIMKDIFLRHFALSEKFNLPVIFTADEKSNEATALTETI